MSLRYEAGKDEFLIGTDNTLLNADMIIFEVHRGKGYQMAGKSATIASGVTRTKRMNAWN
jgi:hypothetical protein